MSHVLNEQEVVIQFQMLEIVVQYEKYVYSARRQLLCYYSNDAKNIM
jgi:hypothetical protein